MTKRIIEAAIKDASINVNNNFVDPDRHRHKARFDTLLNHANPTPLPDYALKKTAYGTVTVTPAQMDKLEQAEQIAMVTKMLLTPGNQKQVIRQTGGLSSLRASYAQSIDPASSSAQRATVAVIVGGGNCGEHACVAFEIAKSLDIPVARYGDRSVDHAYVALYPESAEPIIIDAWTDFPTICQKSEYILEDPCNTNKLQAKYVPGDVTDTSFNLDAIMQVKEKVTSQLSENGIDNVLKEEVRKIYGISSKALDQIMLSQGVASYDAIDTSHLNEKEKTEVVRKQNKVNGKLENTLKQWIERACIPFGTPQIETRSVVTKAKGGTNVSDFEQARISAKKEADIYTQSIASTQALLSAKTSASKKRLPKSTKTKSCSATVSMTVGEATVNVTSTSTVTISVKQALWDTQINAITHSYKANDRPQRDFNRVPVGHYEDLATAKNKYFPNFTKLDAFKAKIGFSTSTFKQIKQSLSGIINQVLNRPLAPTQLELQNGIDQHMQTILQNLSQHLNTPGDTSKILADIEKRIDDASPSIRDQALLSLSAMLPRLSSGNFEHGVQILRQWLEYTSTAANYSQAIDQLTKQWKSNFDDIQNSNKELAIRNALDRYLPPKHLTLEATSLLSRSQPLAIQTKAICFIVDRLHKVNDATELYETIEATIQKLQTLPRENLSTFSQAINTMPPKATINNAQPYDNRLITWLNVHA